MFDRVKKLFGQYTYWYCDNCGHLMNNQKGFSDKTGAWECRICGFNNDVTAKNLGDNKIKKQFNKETEAYYKRFERIPFKYNKIITEEKLVQFAIEASEGVERIEEISVSECKVFGTVRTLSGLDNWDFMVDFNYYGEVTGDYKNLFSSNNDSSIPYAIAKRIKTAIQNEYSRSGVIPPNPETPRYDTDYSCERCGAQLKDQYGYNKDCMFWKCKSCGTMNKLPPHYVTDRKIDNVNEDGHEIFIPH